MANYVAGAQGKIMHDAPAARRSPRPAIRTGPLPLGFFLKQLQLITSAITIEIHAPFVVDRQNESSV